jgi:hypothetical protein
MSQRTKESNRTYYSTSNSEQSWSGFLGKIIENVYRCDSAAVVDSAYQCGSLATEALYQGVEVVYKCDGDEFRKVAGDFYTHQCYCGDGNPMVEQEIFIGNEHGFEARNDMEEGISANGEETTRAVMNTPAFLSSALTFEDSILNGPNSINELSSAGSSLIGSVGSEPKPDTKFSSTINSTTGIGI